MQVFELSSRILGCLWKPAPERLSWDQKLRILEYHHHNMESRRSIEIRTFAGVLALDLAVAKGVVEVLGSLQVIDPSSLKVIVQAAYWAIFIGFTVFVVLIENSSRFDRQRYHALERHIWNHLQGQSEQEVKVQDEPLGISVIRSWAAAPPVLGLLLLTILCSYFVGQLKV